MTMRGRTIMNDDRGSGLARFKDNRRKYIRLVGGLALGGGIIGGTSGILAGFNGYNFTGTQMQVVAVIAVAAFMIVVTVGSWKYFTTVDELEVDANKWAGLIAINFYAMLWMCWTVLGRVELTSAPNGDAVFLLTILVATVTFLWRRFR